MPVAAEDMEAEERNPDDRWFERAKHLLRLGLGLLSSALNLSHRPLGLKLVVLIVMKIKLQPVPQRFQKTAPLGIGLAVFYDHPPGPELSHLQIPPNPGEYDWPMNGDQVGRGFPDCGFIRGNRAGPVLLRLLPGPGKCFPKKPLPLAIALQRQGVTTHRSVSRSDFQKESSRPWAEKIFPKNPVLLRLTLQNSGWDVAIP